MRPLTLNMQYFGPFINEMMSLTIYQNLNSFNKW